MNRAERRRRAALARAKSKIEAKSAAPVKAQAKRLDFTCPVSIKAQDAANPNAVRTFQMNVYTGEPMNIWPWDAPVVIDVASLDLSAQAIPALYNHGTYDPSCVVGQINRLAVEAGILAASGQFVITDEPLERNYAKQVLNRADAGYQWQVSVGGDPASVEQVKAGTTVQVNGRTYTGPCYVARGLAPREVSFVILGGDRRTSAVVGRNRTAIKGQAMNFEQWCLGFMTAEEFTALDESAKGALEKAYDASGTKAAEDDPMPEEKKPDEETPAPAAAAAKPPAIQASVDVAAQMRKAAADELARQDDLRQYVAASGVSEVEIGGKKVNLLQHAIAANWNRGQVAEAALAHVRAERGSGPNVIARDGSRNFSLQALQGGMILRAGGKLDHAAYKGMGGRALLGKVAPWLLQDINAADRNMYMEAAHRVSNMSMLDLCRHVCHLNGQDDPRDRDELIRAAFSGGGNLTNVFTTNVNAILLSSYTEFSDDTTKGWVSETDVNDFKTNERPRVQISDGLKRLPRGGTAEHTSYTDTVESYKIGSYARQFALPEEDIVDDNFGVFQDTPRVFGMAAARLRPDLVYGAVILANPTMSATSVALFSDSNSPDNLFASSALTHATLSTALAKMRLVRENSVNLNLQATHLLVPPTLEDTAIELTQSALILFGGDNETVRGNMNTMSRRGLQIIAEPRIENGVVNPADETSQSGSDSTWYLICGDGRVHTIEVGYLKGTGRAPKVRSKVLDEGKWGMQWDVRMEIGVKALDHKGFNKSTA